MAEEYKFPDEVEQKVEIEAEAAPSVEVEVVDDTPKQDQGREAMPSEVVEELEKDDLSEYSDKVRKRLGQMKKVWHDERRAKETSTREKDEAVRVAQAYFEENKHLKQRYAAGEQAYMGMATQTATAELAASKEKLKQAYDSGDSELITAAQEAMTDAKLKLQEYQRYRPTLQREESRVEPQQQVQAPPAPVVDHKAEAWRKRNAWFGEDEEMTALALGLHEKLVKSGVDPRSDEYYHRVDETMRKRFSENFEDAPQTTSQPSRRAANVVAPATRSTAPTKVRLTQTQLGLAKKFGIDPIDYAKEVIKLENANG